MRTSPWSTRLALSRCQRRTQFHGVPSWVGGLKIRFSIILQNLETLTTSHFRGKCKMWILIFVEYFYTLQFFHLGSVVGICMKQLSLPFSMQRGAPFRFQRARKCLRAATTVAQWWILRFSTHTFTGVAYGTQNVQCVPFGTESDFYAKMPQVVMILKKNRAILCFCSIGHILGRPQKKTRFAAYKLTTKYKVTNHARNTLTKNGGSTLRFGPPVPPRENDPYN